jgi:hypothetical protein
MYSLISEANKVIRGELEVKNESDESSVQKIILDKIRSEYGLVPRPPKIDGDLHVIHSYPDYVIQDQRIAAQYKKFSVEIKAGGDSESGYAIIVFNTSFEYVNGGRNGHSIRLGYEPKSGKWRYE